MLHCDPCSIAPSGFAKATPLSWALCVATLDRVDMLERCVSCALDQTRPPSQIIIVDASIGWQSHHDRIAAVVGRRVSLTYLPAPKRSLTVQRNTAIAACTADICVMIDDDSLMHPDCMDIIMRIYEADTGAEIAGIEGGDGPSPMELADVARKNGTEATGLADRITGSRAGAFLWKHLFMMNRAVTFVPYAGKAGSAVPDWAAAQGFDLVPTDQLAGCRMTARRSALLHESFGNPPHG